MLKTMLIGEWRSGKSSLIRCLTGLDYRSRKVLALDFFNGFVNTPSEFLENRRFYPSIITASADCDILIFVQAADRTSSQLPPKFASMFKRRVLGVVTKIDVPSANAVLARRFLVNAGVRDIYEVSSVTGSGIAELKCVLCE
ncbi:MAG: ethanolamine utilization protein EutP [Mailhella sp.]|nr:ethanolamine utilization protein EutP [Mailhella sp.]